MVVTVRWYLPLCCGRTVPEVSEEEGSYTSHFYRWFLESFKSFLLLLVVLSGLIDTLAQLLAGRSLLWLSVTWRRRSLTESHFLSTTSLVWSLALRLLFCSVRRSLYSGRKYTKTHTNIHTHTHTHTHRSQVTTTTNRLPTKYFSLSPKETSSILVVRNLGNK